MGNRGKYDDEDEVEDAWIGHLPTSQQSRKEDFMIENAYWFSLLSSDCMRKHQSEECTEKVMIFLVKFWLYA